jgi:long-chain acyl-CoA synthetase
VIDSHDAVRMSCVIGVPDPIKIRKIKAFVILNEGYKPSLQLKDQIISYCRKYLAKYAMPYDIEFRTELPKTLVGKVDYRQLENEQ